MTITHVKVFATDRDAGGEIFITLEEFAKLFTYGLTYSMAAMRGEEAPINEIRVAQSEGATPKEVT